MTKVIRYKCDNCGEESSERHVSAWELELPQLHDEFQDWPRYGHLCKGCSELVVIGANALLRQEAPGG